MWRKPSEAFQPDLAGDDPYGKQAPLARVIPMWGGLSHGGVSVLFHRTKKVQTEEWVGALKKGCLKEAIRSLKPVNRVGPWHMLCDQEGFLRAKDSMKEYKKMKLKLQRVIDFLVT